jgi:hypothetical protein
MCHCELLQPAFLGRAIVTQLLPSHAQYLLEAMMLPLSMGST